MPLRGLSVTRFERRGQPRRVAPQIPDPHGDRDRVVDRFDNVGLAIGIAGYAAFEGMSFVDAYVNAAMILSGMGPLGELKTTAGKIFAGSYAILSGLIIVIATGFRAGADFPSHPAFLPRGDDEGLKVGEKMLHCGSIPRP